MEGILKLLIFAETSAIYLVERLLHLWVAVTGDTAPLI